MDISRRNFFGTIGTLVAGFTILPAATTYNRVWNFKRSPTGLMFVPNSAYKNAKYEVAYLFGSNNLEDIYKKTPTLVVCEVGSSLPVFRSDKEELPLGKFVENPFPIRFNETDSNGDPIIIYPYKAVKV